MSGPSSFEILVPHRFHAGPSCGSWLTLSSLGRPLRPLLGSLLLALPLGLVACALSGSGTVPTGSRVVVRLYDAGSNLDLALANESHPQLSDVYSTPQSNGTLKLAPDLAMQDLLAEIQATGFDRFAKPDATLPGVDRNDGRSWGADQRRLGVRGAVQIWQGRDSKLFLVPAGRADGGDELTTFVSLKLIIAQHYQKASGLQFISNDRGRRILTDQNERYLGGRR